jgi:hypothetical protein
MATNNNNNNKDENFNVIAQVTNTITTSLSPNDFNRRLFKAMLSDEVLKVHPFITDVKIDKEGEEYLIVHAVEKIPILCGLISISTHIVSRIRVPTDVEYQTYPFHIQSQVQVKSFGGFNSFDQMITMLTSSPMDGNNTEIQLVDMCKMKLKSWLCCFQGTAKNGFEKAHKEILKQIVHIMTRES